MRDYLIFLFSFCRVIKIARSKILLFFPPTTMLLTELGYYFVLKVNNPSFLCFLKVIFMILYMPMNPRYFL